jgi:hypothetical protein
VDSSVDLRIPFHGCICIGDMYFFGRIASRHNRCEHGVSNADHVGLDGRDQLNECW